MADETMMELATAIYAGDLAKCREVLTVLGRDRSYYAEAIARGKASGERMAKALSDKSTRPTVFLKGAALIVAEAKRIRSAVDGFVDNKVDDDAQLAAEDVEELIDIVEGCAKRIINEVEQPQPLGVAA